MTRKVSTTIYQGDRKFEVEDAKVTLGWESERESGKKFEDKFDFRDLNGDKVRLSNNRTNRPFTRSLALRWANEMLRKKWRLNGEGAIVDHKGQVQSGQHRLVGLVFAEQLRKKNVSGWKEKRGWNGPVSIEFMVVEGISDSPEVVDTIDQGKKRSLADVMYRNKGFAEATPKQQKTLSLVCSVATRLTWLRVGGKKVSDAPHFPVTEAIEFLQKHPKLADAVEFVWRLDAGENGEGSRISSGISLGYASALLYLMACVKTEPGEAPDVESKSFRSLWGRGCEFWTAFASGANLAEKSPILVLKRALARKDAGSGKARDEMVGMVIKAFNAWLDGGDISAADLKVKSVKGIAEEPRLGGLDTAPVEDEVVFEAPEVVESAAEEETATGRELEEGFAKAVKKGGDMGRKAKRERKKASLGKETVVETVEVKETPAPAKAKKERKPRKPRGTASIKVVEDEVAFEPEEADIVQFESEVEAEEEVELV